MNSPEVSLVKMYLSSKVRHGRPSASPSRVCTPAVPHTSQQQGGMARRLLPHTPGGDVNTSVCRSAQCTQCHACSCSEPSAGALHPGSCTRPHCGRQEAPGPMGAPGHRQAGSILSGNQFHVCHLFPQETQSCCLGPHLLGRGQHAVTSASWCLGTLEV